MLTWTIAATLLAGPPINTLERAWLDFIHDPGREPVTMTQPVNCNITNVHTLNETTGDVFASIIHDDSNGRFTTSPPRLGAYIKDKIGNVIGMFMPFDPDFAGVHFQMGAAPGSWSDGGQIGRTDSWPSGGTNASSDHISEGWSVELSGASTHPDNIWQFYIDRNYWGIPDVSFNQDTSFYVIYRKNAWASDADFYFRRAFYSDGDTPGVDTPTISGSNDATLTFESGSGLGFVDFFRDSSGGNLPDTATFVGFEVRSSGTLHASKPYPANAAFEMPGVLVLFNSVLANGKSVVDDTEGIIICPMSTSGSDPYDMHNRTSDDICQIITEILARVKGDGTTDDPKPIDSIHNMLGQNPPDSGEFSANMQILEDKWLVTAIPDAGVSAGNLPDVIYYSEHAHDSNNGRVRMDEQRTKMQEFCAAQTYRAHANEYDYFGGLAPDEVSGNDPFGDAYATFSMDGNSLHPTTAATAQAIWDVRLKITADANALSGGCTFGTNRSRERDGTRSR